MQKSRKPNQGEVGKTDGTDGENHEEQVLIIDSIGHLGMPKFFLQDCAISLSGRAEAQPAVNADQSDLELTDSPQQAQPPASDKRRKEEEQ